MAENGMNKPTQLAICWKTDDNNKDQCPICWETITVDTLL